MGLLTDERAELGCAIEAVGFYIPALPEETSVTGGRQRCHVGHRGASDKGSAETIGGADKSPSHWSDTSSNAAAIFEFGRNLCGAIAVWESNSW